MPSTVNSQLKSLVLSSHGPSCLVMPCLVETRHVESRLVESSHEKTRNCWIQQQSRANQINDLLCQRPLYPVGVLVSINLINLNVSFKTYGPLF